MSLTTGILKNIIDKEDVKDPLVQVICCKPVQKGGQERFRMLLSDGKYSNGFCMLATNLSSLIHEKKMEPYTIIRLTDYTVNVINGERKILCVNKLDVVQPGEEVGKQIGKPIAIQNDGTIAQNQNEDPNSGMKRTSEPVGGPPAKVPAPNTNRNNPKPSLNNYSMDAGGPITPISAITPYQNKWTIKARVTSKSDIRTWNKSTGSGKLFSMDLMDESGEIRATAFNDQVDMYFESIQVGQVYKISRCSVKAANKTYSKLNNDYELTFKDNVVVTLVDDKESSEVPTMSYNFVKIGELSGASKDQLVDVIGVCKMSNDPISITTRAGKELLKREILIVDETNAEVMLTLWGNTANNFTGDSNPVVAVKGAKVSDFNGVSLSGGDLLVNPDMKPRHVLEGWWENGGKRGDFTSLTVQGQRGSGAVDMGSMKCLSEVKMENLGLNSDRGDYFSTVATVTFFNKEKALYKACANSVDGKECNKKVSESGDGTYRCEKCSIDSDNFKWRLILSLTLGDATDSLWATCFQESAEKILGLSSEEIGQYSERDEERYNAVFAGASFATYNFRMRAKAETYNDDNRVKYVILGADKVNYEELCKQRMKQIEMMGGCVPDTVDKSVFM